MSACPFTVDLDTSTLTLAGRRLPAVGVVCPIGPGPDNSRPERTLSALNAGHEPFPHIEVVVPTENGVLVQLAWFKDRPGLIVQLGARTCELTPSDDDPIWLPIPLAVVAGRIEATSRTDLGKYLLVKHLIWRDAEPDWVVEHIDRVARLPYDEPPGPRVELVRLGELPALQAELAGIQARQTEDDA